MPFSTFDGFGLVEPLRLALKTEKYLKPTPIQVQTIPLLAQGKDMLGIAETGSGKTAAFALPILQRLSLQRLPRTPAAPHALILAPTRELASQIGQRFGAYGRGLPLRSTVIFGGVSQHHQVKALKAGVDILVATPGRLLDLCNQRLVRLDQVSILVLDEADRMLDMGFIHDVRKIVSLCRRQRQTLLFSATMPAPIAKLAQDILTDPIRVDVAPAKIAVDRIDQRVFFVGAKEKRALLEGLLADRAMDRVLVFTRTKRGADRVCRNLTAIRLGRRRLARQQGAERARAGARRFPQRPRAYSRRHRYRRPRHRRAEHLARRQLRAAQRAGELRAPYRPHRPSRSGRRCLVVLRSQRAASSSGDRALDAVDRHRRRASACRCRSRRIASAAAPQ